MQVQLQFKASKQLLKDHLIDTGKKLKDHFVAVEMETLTPEERRIIGRCGINYDGSVSLPGVVVDVVGSGYDAPRFMRREQQEVHVIPTADQWLRLASRALASEDEFQPRLDTLLAEQKAAADAKAARIGELQATYRALAEKWEPIIETMTEEEANKPLPEEVRSVENELNTLRAMPSRSLLKQKSARWQTLRDERIKRETAETKDVFIEAHGSDHLKRAHAGGYDCTRKYVRERAAHEAPGFVVDIEDDASWGDRSCPSLAALNAADAAAALGLGTATIVWLKSEPHDTKVERDPYDYDEPFEQCEAIVISDYLGKYDLVKIL